jgi:arsenite methyltransferase
VLDRLYAAALQLTRNRDDTEDLVPDASVDVITSNGVMNLVPDKPRAIRELFRVLRPGGRVQITDIVIGANEDTLAEARDIPRLWAECIVGAVTEPDYFAMFEAAGFTRPQTLETFDYFSKSCKQETREIAASFQAHGILLTTGKPAGNGRNRRERQTACYPD